MNQREAGKLLELLRLRNGPSEWEAASLWADLSKCDDLLAILRLEGATLWLYRRLHDLHITMDAPVANQLRRTAHEELLRGLRIDEELAAVAAILRRNEIDFRAIKGPARRVAAKLYPYADARSTSDVDLLLPEAVAQRAWDALVDDGYESIQDPGLTPAEHFHLPGLWSHRRVGIEIHTSTSPWIDPAEAWKRQAEGGDVVEWMGATFRVANATELLWHAMSHSVVDGALGVRLRTFLDGASVLASGRVIHWPTILERIEAGELRDLERDVPVRPQLLHKWIATAAVLAGTSLHDGFGAEVYPLARLIHWKSLALKAGLVRAARERLTEEGIRAEFGLSMAPSPQGTHPLARGRRRLATVAARVGYTGWKTFFAR